MSRKPPNNPLKNWAVDLNRHFFSREDIQIANIHKKILKIVNYHRNANQNHNVISPHICLFDDCHQKDHRQQMLARMWRKRNSSILLVGMLIGSATMETSMKFPQKMKNKTTMWQRNSTLGYISKENENTNSKIYMHPNVYNSIIYSSQYTEAT